jgi:hypothetical protein
MDPLSITAATVALSGAIIQIGVTVEAASSKWTEAEKEIKQASDEHKTMKKILDELTSFKANLAAHQANSPSLEASRLLIAIEPLRSLIAEIEAAFPERGKTSHIKKRLLWISKDRSRKEKLLSRLNTVWNIIHLPLEIERL